MIAYISPYNTQISFIKKLNFKIGNVLASQFMLRTSRCHVSMNNTKIQDGSERGLPHTHMVEHFLFSCHETAVVINVRKTATNFFISY